MKHIIDIESSERKDSILFFKKFANPNISITSEVECTGAKEKAKLYNTTFFLYYTHAIMKAVNEIKEFKYRIDTDGNLVYYDTIHAEAIIRTGENGAYNTVRLTYHNDLKTFVNNASKKIRERAILSNRFSIDEADDTKETNLFLVSAVPGLSFTSMTFAQAQGMEGLYPVSLIGKVITREGKEYIPIAICVNHALIDGYHLDKFYSRITELLLG